MDDEKLADDAKFEEELALNRNAYEELRDQIRRDYAGQYVAMAFGRIISVSPSFVEARSALERLRPPSQSGIVFPAEMEPMFEPVEDGYVAPREND